MNKKVKNCPALSSFAHIEKLDIPSKLFGEAVIPESVYYEGVLKAKRSERVERIKRCIEEGQIPITPHIITPHFFRA